mmetsp:Transcript_119982/g.274919  ORF Transcript_119982/g.274919 Transcript_119982/m.274919 type:complete len:177 (+) Transcript_119982:1-531(+)
MSSNASDTGVGSVNAPGELPAPVSESTRSRHQLGSSTGIGGSDISLLSPRGTSASGLTPHTSSDVSVDLLPMYEAASAIDFRASTVAVSESDSGSVEIGSFGATQALRRPDSEHESTTTQSSECASDAGAEEDEYLDDQVPQTTAEDSAVQSAAARPPRVLVERPFEGVVEDISGR